MLMNDKTDFEDLDEEWSDDSSSDDGSDDGDETADSPLLKSLDNKDVRRRLDDLLEERRLKKLILDDYYD
ncbi:MAG TPA: hypothetical protein ENN02_00100 [Halothiobacillus sp.]|nr:hypothetical protein [Halothiobacillus sp.]